MVEEATVTGPRPFGSGATDETAVAEGIFEVGHLPGYEHRVADELRERLLDHLYHGRSTSALGHSAVAALSVLVFWETVGAPVALGWLGLFLGITWLQEARRRRTAPSAGDHARILRRVRGDVWLSAALWGVFIGFFVGVPDTDLAILMIVVAGLIAAATSTLVADPPSFHGFTALLLVPLAAVIALGGLGRVHVSLLLLVAVFGPFMISVHRRAHRILQANFASNARLAISEEETARARDFLNALVAGAPSPIVVLDREGRVVRANPAFERATGHRWAEAHGRPVGSLFGDGPEGRALASFVDSIREGARSVAELRLPRADGHAIWMRLTGTAAGRLAGGSSIVVAEDVTDQVLAREAQVAARLEAERAARAKSSFLATMSHEIRTPLNGILGMIELLRDTPLTGEQMDSLRVVQTSAQGLMRVLNDVLDVSKIEAGQLDLEDVDFDLSEVVTQVAKVFAFQASGRGSELLVDVPADVPAYVHTDPHRLRQVLSNLVSNAVKFTEDGEIVVSARRVGEDADAVRVRFSVRDTGIGIPPEKQEMVFAEFEQADSSTTRVHGGTGLGLTIAKRLVDLLGGTLELDSEPGRGSEFYFTLRLPRATERARERRASAVSLEGRRFLVVDDNDTARRIVREALLTQGAEVEEAAGAEAALALLRETPRGRALDCVVVDQQMPGADGFDFVVRLLAEERESIPAIVMLTSAPSAAGRARARDVGVGAYLAKPASRADLLRVLRSLLGGEAPDGAERRLITDESLQQSPTAPRVLLAEDNPINQQVAVALLRKRGCEVDLVENGAEAVLAALSKPYDLVLLDIQMPELDGFEVVRRIREHAHLASLPVVAVTAHAFQEERDRARDEGMNDFVTKPFDAGTLYAVLERWTRINPWVPIEHGS